MMTQLLDRAIAAARQLTPSEQDDIARAILALAAPQAAPVTLLTDAEQKAIAKSKAAAARGEFASDADVRAVWVKHGL
jgi:hypothetical protein